MSGVTLFLSLTAHVLEPCHIYNLDLVYLPCRVTVIGKVQGQGQHIIQWWAHKCCVLSGKGKTQNKNKQNVDKVNKKETEPSLLKFLPHTYTINNLSCNSAIECYRLIIYMWKWITVPKPSNRCRLNATSYVSCVRPYQLTEYHGNLNWVPPFVIR